MTAGARDHIEGDVDDGPLSAGPFSSWLTGMQAALRGERDADVPCHACTACCTASQFVHIAPDEHDALAHVPTALLFPAPGLPPGHVVLGYDERGHCPMLVDGRCSIYEHRPRTCRTYDCRIFAAAGTEPDGTHATAVAARVRRWRFEFPTAADRMRHEAVRAAAAFVGQDTDARPPNATQVALRAIDTYADFVDRER
jgi:uncharacterized protein